MLTIPVINQKGEKTGEHKLSPEVFGVEPNQEMIQQVVVAHLANQRAAYAHTKSRGEVRGGGRKPWRQKGTGRARAGTIRSPLWRGGAITFGPLKERNYKQKINKKVRRKAILMCLSDKVNNNQLLVLDKLSLPEIKTRSLFNVLNKIIPEKNKKILLALVEKNLILIKSGQNIENLTIISTQDINTLGLLKAGYLLTTVKGIKKIEAHFTGESIKQPELKKKDKKKVWQTKRARKGAAIRKARNLAKKEGKPIRKQTKKDKIKEAKIKETEVKEAKIRKDIKTEEKKEIKKEIKTKTKKEDKTNIKEVKTINKKVKK